MKITMKLVTLLQKSIKLGYEKSKNSSEIGSREIMNKLYSQLGGVMSSPIPDPSTKNYDQELKQGFYFIINLFNQSRFLTGNLLSELESNDISKTFEVHKYSDDEIHQIAEKISQQQLQIFTKCRSLKFGVFRDKEYKITNPDGSIFQVTKEKEKGTIYYSMHYEKRSHTTGKIITSYRLDLDKNGIIKNYLALSESTFDRTGRGVLNFTDSSSKDSDFAFKTLNHQGKDLQTDQNLMNDMLEQIQKI